MNNEYELRWIYVYIVYNCKTDRLIFSDVMYIGQTNDLIQRNYTHLCKSHNSHTLVDKFLRTHRCEYIPLMCGFAKDIDCMEKYLIREWDTLFVHGTGLNISIGGRDGGGARVPIDQYDKCGRFIRTYFGGALEACIINNFKNPTTITKCCKGKLSSYKGYMWKYHTGDTISHIDPHIKKYARKRKVYQYNLDKILIKEWDSVREAERALHINHGDIIKCCNGKINTYKGYIFSYEKI